nr:response regulator transcription factor [uncultured Prevotella sp.]
MKAIIVDDDKVAGMNLEQLLKEKYQMDVAGVALNGLDGLALVNQHQPDVLFLDVQLPDISGLDFLDRIAAFTHGQCRVVMYTAYDEFILPAFRKKAFDVLLKPIDPEELATIMKRLQEAAVPVAKESETDGVQRKKGGKFLLYTNTLDFKLIDKRDIGLFQYNHEMRCWEVIVAGSKQPIRLKRCVKSDALVELDGQFVQVNQKFIINMDYLIEVVDNVCHFYPPFDMLDYVKVGRLFRKKLIDRFCSL